MAEVKIAKTTEDATAAWVAMTANQQAEVKAKLEEGDDPVRAVNSVLYDRPIEAAARGAARFVTLGLDDNIVGAGAAARAAYQRLSDVGLTDGEGVFDSLSAAASEGRAAHSRAIDERRAFTDDLYATNPKSYGVSAVLGTLATIPFTGGAGVAARAPHFARALMGGARAAAGRLGRSALAGAKAAAPIGAVSGVGLGDADTVRGVAGDALAGAGLGALLGAGAPIAGRAITAAADKVKGAASSALAYGGQNADILRVLTTMGKTGGVQNAPAALKAVAAVPGKVPEAARVLRATGISKGVTTTEGILKRAEKAKEDSGELIGEIIEATDAGGGRVDGKAVAAALRQEAADIQNPVVGSGGALSSLDPRKAAAVDSLIAAARRYDKAGMMTLREAQARISGPKGLGKEASFEKRAIDLPTRAESDTAASAVQALRAGMDEAVERTGLTGNLPASVTSSKLLDGMASSTPKEAYQSLRRVHQVAIMAAKEAEISVGRGSKNNLIDLTSATLANASPKIAFAHLVLKGVQSSGRASGAEAMRALGASLAKADVGAAMRPAVDRLSQAASVSGPALKAAFEDLMRTDSAFAAAIDEATGTSAEQRRAALVSLSP